MTTMSTGGPTFCHLTEVLHVHTKCFITLAPWGRRNREKTLNFCHLELISRKFLLFSITIFLLDDAFLRHILTGKQTTTTTGQSEKNRSTLCTDRQTDRQRIGHTAGDGAEGEMNKEFILFLHVESPLLFLSISSPPPPANTFHWLDRDEWLKMSSPRLKLMFIHSRVYVCTYVKETIWMYKCVWVRGIEIESIVSKKEWKWR